MILRFVLRRLLLLFPVLVGVLVVTFILVRLLPADPVHLLVGPEEGPEAVQQVIKDLGLDQPLHIQLIRYVRGIVRGDLGKSFTTRNAVTEDLRQRLPATLELTTLSLILAALLGIPLGVFSAVKKDALADHLTRVLTLVGVAMPVFWLGILLVFTFFYKLDMFPAPLGRVGIGLNMRDITGFYTVDALLQRDWEAFKSVALLLVMPVFALSLRSLASLTRLTRSAMLEILSADYIRTARAMGLTSRVVHYRHALKNAVVVPVTELGNRYGDLLGGAVLVEIIFSWPGVGLWAVNAAKAGDYYPVQAFVIVAALLRVMIFLLVDLIHFFIDPRLRA